MHMRYYLPYETHIFHDANFYYTEKLDDLLAKIKIAIENNYHIIYIDFGNGQVLFDN